MRNPPGLPLAESRPGLRLWLHPEVQSWRGGLPRDGAVAAASGRGPLLRIPFAGGHALVRRYRRGGLLRRVLPDLFLSPARAFAEVAACARLAPLGLAPRVLALEVAGRAAVSLRLAVEEIPDAVNLLALGVSFDAMTCRAVGHAVRAMHDAGVAHADLNAANVLVAGTVGPVVRAVIVDLDGARLFEGPVPPARRRQDVLRLGRTIDKRSATAATPAAARAAFLRAALPSHERLPALRAARRQHALRSALGRTARRARGR